MFSQRRGYTREDRDRDRGREDYSGRSSSSSFRDRRESSPEPAKPIFSNARTDGVVSSITGPIDHATTCPMLIRMFLKDGHSHSPSEFADGQVPSDEVYCHAWRDTSLRTLRDIIMFNRPALRQRQARLGFAVMYCEPKTDDTKFVPQLFAPITQSLTSPNHRTLREFGFVLGDYFTIAILTGSYQSH